MGSVQNCSKNVETKVLEVSDFYLFEDKSSQHKLRSLQPRVFLKNIVSVQARRGSFDLYYKTTHKDEGYEALNFLQQKCLKMKNIPKPPQKSSPRGITEHRKQEIIQKLCPLMPSNRRLFWENLPINNTSRNLALNDDEEVNPQNDF